MPIKLFLDDTSALKSKKWMALHCVQMQLSGLPLSEMQNQGSVQFVGATEKADIMDIAAIVNEDIKKMQLDGIKSFDAMSKERCVVKSCVDIIVADYAMMSYCCNHLGAASTKYCPKCYADSDNFMTIAQNRTPRETQLQIQRINLRSSEKDKKKLRKKKGVKEHRNVIWDILDPHKDIPVGMLHLIPLGLAKHLVKLVVNQCNESLVRKMDIHLQYVCPESRFQNFFKYIDSRQGKDFKDYLQVATFNMLFADVPRPLVKMVAYLASVEDIQRHGPPKAFAEDAFEKNHGAIRNMIFLQNQKARSRDTCIKFAKQYLCMHVISGGYFEQDNNWCQATSAVTRLGLQSPVLDFLGADTYTDSNKQRPGTISLFERDQKKKIVVENPTDDILLQALLSLNIEDHHFDQYKLMRGSGVRAENGILIHSGEWVSYLDSEKQELIGVFKEGLVIIPKRGAHLEVVVLWKTNILNKKVMGCQVREKSSTITMVPSKNLEKISVVHNCSAAKCRIVEAISYDKVEQENVLKKSTHLKHNLLVNQYIVNQFYL